ncbi:hypothetical protein GCM10007939_18040 [Amylibacter marinus]|uniref:DUF454 domain-containing protein n=1 Tax=Amylibacter marinus TaxID=1475483 RepID=A0ABQ5VVP8_9RHOB|nr:YbaN family protein [Amylibacter marinus]GLQ35521.1 hypothetical protein GCM10007939_18040 [Amylibacter marinus]
MKTVWFIGGMLSLAIGVLGIFLPLLPTVPLLLLAAFCFARSSQRMHDWLVQHPTLGPPIKDWNEKGAINPRAKRLATFSIAAVFGISIALGLRPILLVVQGATLCCVLVFIWSRPSD